MDDYRDLVAAGFAILFAALMLVAWLFLIRDKPEGSRSDPRLEPPGVATSQSISSKPIQRAHALR
jgi:hypothetical protein